jgi:rhodanese-related sulfurtransferase
VGYGEELEIPFNLLVGQRLIFTVLPEIRESYPVQVTAVKIEWPEDSVDAAGEYRKITPEEAKEMIDAGDVIILDVRTEQEFEEAHIENAILLPDYDIEALAPETLTDKDATILIYCRSGRRSEAAAKELIEMGYTNTYDFGGIIDWPYATVSGE